MKRTCILVLGALLAVACGPNRETQIKNIEEHEQNLSMFDMGSDDAQAEEMLGLYHQFVKDFPDDSLAPVYLVKLADINIALGRTDEAVACLDSVINLYPGYDDLGGCLFLKGVAYEANEQYDLARQAYTVFVDNYPDHYLASDTRKMLPYVGMTPEEMLEAIMKGEPSEI